MYVLMPHTTNVSVTKNQKVAHLMVGWKLRAQTSYVVRKAVGMFHNLSF